MRQRPANAKRFGMRARQRRFGPEKGVVAQLEEFCLTPNYWGGLFFESPLVPDCQTII
jgi:hypothetical protein